MESIGNLRIVNSKNIFTQDTKLSALVYAPPKFGKTTLASTLNDLTMKYMDKPTLYVMCEAGDGGGVLSVKEKNLSCVFPETVDDIEMLLTQLRTDTTFGGVVFDSVTEMVHRILKPYIVNTTVGKMSASELASRKEGVPVRSDYNRMNERGRYWLNQLVNLSALTKTDSKGVRVPDLDRRKHVIATAHTKIKTDDQGTVVRIQPELPGQLSESACGLFQSVLSLSKSVLRVTDPATGRKVAKPQVSILTETDDSLYLVGDRFGIFKNGDPPDLLHIYESYFLPEYQKE